MFKEITDMPTIMELGAAGMLWDSWYVRETDPSRPQYGELGWDMMQPIEGRHWDIAQYEMHDPAWNARYKFYLQIEE